MKDQILIESYDVIGWLTTLSVRLLATLSDSTINMNSLDYYRLAYGCMHIQQDNHDVLVMIKTSHSAATLKEYVRLLRDKLGAGTAVNRSVDVKPRPREPGGIITIIGVRELSK